MMTESNPIILYDFTSKIGVPWNPNVLKAHFSLNYKGLHYKVEWVEYPDVEELSKKLGIGPTSKKRNGDPFYTLPAIYDPNTKTGLADSILIAEYLDKTYPDTPKLLPPGSHALTHAWASTIPVTVQALWQFTMPESNAILNPRSEEYFRRTREAFFNTTMEEMEPKGDAAKAQWAILKEQWGQVDGWVRKSAHEGPYVMGNQISFADFVLAAQFTWMKIVWGEDSEKWKDVMTWHDGRWVELLRRVEKFAVAKNSA